MKLYKKSYEITIKDYSIMERTGRINHFANWIIVYWLFKSKIISELEKVNKILNSSQKIDDENENLKWEIESLIKINIIESSYLGAINLLELGTKINIFKQLMIRRNKRKIKVTQNNLETYLKYLEKYAGIEVKQYSDLEKIRKNLKFSKAKFNENFIRKPKYQNNVFLMSVVLGVFSYLNQPINENMTIVDFSLLREQAIKGIERDKIK